MAPIHSMCLTKKTCSAKKKLSLPTTFLPRLRQSSLSEETTSALQYGLHGFAICDMSSGEKVREILLASGVCSTDDLFTITETHFLYCIADKRRRRTSVHSANLLEKSDQPARICSTDLGHAPRMAIFKNRLTLYGGNNLVLVADNYSYSRPHPQLFVTSG
jgi:hypothetical protein